MISKLLFLPVIKNILRWAKDFLLTFFIGLGGMPYLGSGLAKFVLTLWMYCPSVLRDCSQEGKWVIPLG